MRGTKVSAQPHETVKEDERRLILHRLSLFEVREAKAIELEYDGASSF